MDYKNYYEQVQWLEVVDSKGVMHFIHPKAPSKISLTSVKKNQAWNEIKVGDVVALRALLLPIKNKQFIGGFDYKMDAKIKAIGANGFIASRIEIMQKEQSNFADFIAELRQKISTRITDNIIGDSGKIAAALMVGDQSQISKEVMVEIRNSGLMHLLSISGLHMALASSLFFVTIRFLLTRSSYLALHYDVKKLAAVFAIIAAYFYLQLSGKPVPAVRSFVMVALVLLAIVFARKANAMRCLALAAFLILLVNPYNIFYVSFQLSFAAIFAMIVVHQMMVRIKSALGLDQLLDGNKFTKYFRKIIWMIIEILLMSLVIELAMMPFLIYHFGNIANYSPLANLIAIPLTTFVTMPLGFLALLLMPLNLHFAPLYLMGISIDWLVAIAHFVANLNHAVTTLPQLSNGAFVAAVAAMLAVGLLPRYYKLLAMVVFIAAMSTTLRDWRKTSMIFDAQQKFFALYNKEDGLIFSRKIPANKKRELWMVKMAEKEFKYLGQFDEASLENKGIKCDKDKCEILLKTESKNKLILVLLNRGKVDEICQNKFDAIINLTSKYKLPKCIAADKKVVDNFDLMVVGNKDGVGIVN